MSSSSSSSSSWSLSPSVRPVKYHGSNELVVRTAPEYTRLMVELIKLAQSSDDKIELRNEIRKCVASLQCDHYRLRTFQLAILEEAVVPYLQEILQSRGGVGAVLSALKPIISTRFTRESRYSQLEVILKLLVESENIKNEENLFQSKLSVLLDKALQKQWKPILTDHRRSLQSIGSKLIILGLVEVIGKPVIMLYPIFNLLMTVQEIFQFGLPKVNPVAKSITISQMTTLIKAVGLLLVTMQLIWVLSSYTGLGYTCLATGIVAVTGSTSDSFIKYYSAPLFSQYMMKMEVFIDQVSNMENITWLVTSAPVESSPARATATPAVYMGEDYADSADGTLPTSPREAESLDTGLRRRKPRGSHT